MVRLREKDAGNEASSRDGQMRERKRETTDDEENNRSARQPSFGAKNTDEKDEDITSGSDTSHNEYEVQSQTESGSLSSSYDDESSEAETIDTQNVETDKKNTDSNQHILRANSNARFGSSSIRLGSLLSQDVDQQTDSATRSQPDEFFSSQHHDGRHQEYLKERHDEHDAHYMKPDQLCGNDDDLNQTIEASKLSAILDNTTRQKRCETEASNLHKARVASMTPASSPERV